ncbi:hypothetical protein K8O68_17955 [Salipaludibacillus sp. CUR1]|uniref:hypothetical protein n=1 Tax=Salipaludibacillus sp. CUR1 TaxID=2820003 RepID=UPI001E551384|nr:hypothetical protein [Salipaludibacillus sp. CUR1]MCE7794266.1 hypothetical protein [Salipaludibacillus sp. CUR1]
MGHLKHEGRPFVNEYLLTGLSDSLLTLKPSGSDHFLENYTTGVEIKWIHLPGHAEGTRLHKLLFRNLTPLTAHIQVRIHYNVLDYQSVPFVYFSPHNEAMMLCHDKSYYLIGGLGPSGGPLQYQTNETDLNNSLKCSPPHTFFQPVSQESSAWGMMYEIQLDPYGYAHLYDWEVSHDNLCALETSHESLRNLLGKKKAPVKEVLKR